MDDSHNLPQQKTVCSHSPKAEQKLPAGKKRGPQQIHPSRKGEGLLPDRIGAQRTAQTGEEQRQGNPPEKGVIGQGDKNPKTRNLPDQQENRRSEIGRAHV